MKTLRRVIAALTLIVIMNATAIAQEAAEVTNVTTTATAAEKQVDKVGHPIAAGDRLKTNRSGALGVAFESSHARHRQIRLAANADVMIAANGESYTLHNGTIQMSVEGAIPVYTGNTVVNPKSTFIVIYDPVANITTVIGLEGSIAVRNRKGGGERTILAREYTTVVRDQEPTAPRFMDDAEYDRQLQPFAFIGRGRPESLVVDYGLLAGGDLDERDQAPVIRPPQVGDPCPWECERLPFSEPKDFLEETSLRGNF